MSSNWTGKRAVVTGGSSGLGRALAEVLVERGARVAIVARTTETLAAAAEELRRRGGDVFSIPTDVTCQPDVDRMAATLRDEWGGVDYFAHCAGRSTRGNAISTSVEEFRELWELNFLSAVRCVQAMASSGKPGAGSDALLTPGGHIVLVGSLASKVAPRFLGAYPPSKFPLVALAQQLRMELADRKIHTLLVCPGPIAREKSSPRNADYAGDVPASALKPAGGARLKAIDPHQLARKILRASERGRADLIVPGKVRLLFALAQLWPSLGDWILNKKTGD